MINNSTSNTSPTNAQNADTDADITTMINKKDGPSIPNKESKLQEQKWAQSLENVKVAKKKN